MTTDTLGPCPPPLGVYPQTYRQPLVSAAYADWQRRRAERAEELLRDAMSLHCLQDPYEEVEELRGRVAAHFDSINAKGDDK